MSFAPVGSLLRRGLEMSQEHLQDGSPSGYKPPVWGVILLAFTAILFIICSFSIEYTFNRLIPTLLMVESPEAIVFEPLAADDVDATINKPNDPELLVAQSQPITASFRRTIRHLRAKAGILSRFRGFSMYIVYSFVFQVISGIVGTALPFFIGPVVADVICAQLALAWTHIVISDPNPKPWYRRIPSYRLWRKVVGPTAIVSLSQQLALALPIYLAVNFGYIREPRQDDSGAELTVIAVKSFSVVLFSVIISFLIVIPSRVILTRVQASLLPDELESVVPFDRTFGGAVVPEIVGGSGMVSIRDAWNSFDWNARIRLVKAYIKAFLLQFAVAFSFVIIAVVEIVLIFGKDFKKMLPENAHHPVGKI